MQDRKLFWEDFHHSGFNVGENPFQAAVPFTPAPPVPSVSQQCSFPENIRREPGVLIRPLQAHVRLHQQVHFIRSIWAPLNRDFCGCIYLARV